MSEYIEWGALADVITMGLVVGAGLPAVFARGVRALVGPGARAELDARPPRRIAAAIACFSVVGSAIVGAIVVIGNGGH
jgi:hypothetical protein